MGLLTSMIAVTIILFAIAIAYVEFRLRSVSQKNEAYEKEATDYFATKKELKEQLDKEIAERRETLRLLDERLASMEKKLFYEQPVTAPRQQTSQQQVPPTDKNVFYFRWPVDDGTFDDTTRQPAQTEDTYYEFRLTDATHAEFRFVTMSDTQLSKANNSSKKYIERACSFTSAKSSRFTCTPGTARLNRGRWVIVEKARIEYL